MPKGISPWNFIWIVCCAFRHTIIIVWNFYCGHDLIYQRISWIRQNSEHRICDQWSVSMSEAVVSCVSCRSQCLFLDTIYIEYMKASPRWLNNGFFDTYGRRTLVDHTWKRIHFSTVEGMPVPVYGVCSEIRNSFVDANVVGTTLEFAVSLGRKKNETESRQNILNVLQNWITYRLQIKSRFCGGARK